MCSNAELQEQITALAKQNADEHKAITVVLQKWDPLMACYEKELTRARAYKVVADDLKTKGNNWKFWLGLIAVALTIVASIFLLAEKIKKF